MRPVALLVAGCLCFAAIGGVTAAASEPSVKARLQKLKADLSLESGKVVGLRLFHDERPLTPDDVAFLTQFVELKSLDFGQRQVDDEALAPLARLTKLESLSLSLAPITEKGLAHVSGLVSLRALNIEGTNVVSLAPLAKLRKLRVLCCDWCPLGDDQMAQLAALEHLEKLELSWTEVTDAGLPHLAGLKQLKVLSIADNRITDAGLPHLYGLKKLEVLHLAGARGKGFEPGSMNVTSDGLARLLSELPSLDPYGVPYDQPEERVKALVAEVTAGRSDEISLKATQADHLRLLAGAGGLRKLDLSLSIADDESLSELPELPNLVELNLTWTWVTDEGLKHLARLPRLEVLLLNDTRVTDAGLAHLASLPKLRELHVHNTLVTGVGFGKWKMDNALEQLDLSRNRGDTRWPGRLERSPGATDADMAAIAKLQRLRSLTLEFFHTDGTITDAGLKQLHSLQRLESLKLYNTQVTDGGLRKLQRALPRLRLED